jgi:single-strand DNA-binding protein
VATSDRFKDQQGNFQDRTEWHNVVAYGKLADIIRDYVKKGNKLYIEGRLTTRSWDDKESGKKVYRTEIVIADLSLLSGRGEEGSGGGGGYSNQRSGSSSGSSNYDQRSSSNDEYANTGITDDDIPF